MANDNVIVNNRFEVEFEGINPIAVQSISGLKISHAKVEFSVGSEVPLKNQLGRKIVEDLTLSVLTFEDDASYQAFVDWINSKEARNGYVTVFDSSNNVSRRWEVLGAKGGSLGEGDLDRSSEGEPLLSEIVLYINDLNILTN